MCSHQSLCPPHVSAYAQLGGGRRRRVAERFPVSVSGATARREAAAAITVYAPCSVCGECLELALRNWRIGQFGVWGGTVPTERQKLRARLVTQLAHALTGNQAGRC
jgi:hypothetical protein